MHDSPKLAPSRYINVPLELRQRKQWVLWRRELSGDRWVKPPYQPTRQLANTTDPSTWSHFEECSSAALLHSDFFKGIGYIFSESDPYFGLDLDTVYRSDAAEAPLWASAIIDGFRGAYIEESPGEDGIHIIGRGHLPTGIRHSWIYQPPGEPKLEPYRVEFFDRARYFTVTGKSNGVVEICNSQEFLDALIADMPKLFALLENKEPPTAPRPTAPRTAARGWPRPPHPGPVLHAGEGRYELLRSRVLYLWGFGLSPKEIEQDVRTLNDERCDPPRSLGLIRQLILDTVKRYPR